MPMQGSIVVDTNAGETALFQALVRRFDASTVTRRKLDVGDVMLVADAGTVYVERKTWLDWAKSLSDGRYANQKARLLAAARGGSDAADDDDGDEAAPATTTTATAAVLYLVEGALTGWSGKVAGGGGGMGPVSKMTNAQLEAAVVMTAVRDGVPVLRSKDGAHSLELLAYLFEKLRAGELLPSADGGAAAAAVRDGVPVLRSKDGVRPPPAPTPQCSSIARPRQARTRSSCWPTSSTSCAPASCCRRAARRRRRPPLATRGSL